MFRDFAVAVVVLGGVGFGISQLTNDGLEGCAPDGDGRIHTVRDDGTLHLSRGWRISNDGTQCFASNGGSAAPEVLKVVGFVENNGNLRRFEP